MAPRVGFDVTKGLCDRLIAAAMKTTENAAVPGLGARPDIIKLECYSYMSLRLSDCAKVHTSSLFGDILPLAARGRRYAIASWTERMVRTHIGPIIDASHASHPNIASELRSAFERSGSAHHLVHAMKREMLTVLCPGALSVALDRALWAHLTEDLLRCLDVAADKVTSRGLPDESNKILIFRIELRSCLQST
jgi:hypothetical protein